MAVEVISALSRYLADEYMAMADTDAALSGLMFDIREGATIHDVGTLQGGINMAWDGYTDEYGDPLLTTTEKSDAAIHRSVGVLQLLASNLDYGAVQASSEYYLGIGLEIWDHLSATIEIPYDGLAKAVVIADETEAFKTYLSACGVPDNYSSKRRCLSSIPLGRCDEPN